MTVYSQSKEIFEQTSVLIVDDDKNLCETLSDIFDAYNLDTKIAHSGKEALDIAENNHFDSVFLDIILPDFHGLDLLRELKKLLPDAVFLVMTGYASLEIALEVISRDGDALFVKPLVIEDVMSRLNTLLENQKLRKELKTMNLLLENKVNERTMQLELLSSLNTKLSLILNLEDASSVIIDCFSEILNFGLIVIAIFSGGINNIWVETSLTNDEKINEYTSELCEDLKLDHPDFKKYENKITIKKVSGIEDFEIQATNQIK